MRFGPTFIKAIVVAVVALLLLIPVQLLRDLINERAQSRAQAVASVSRGWAGRQLVGGPILAIPATVSDETHREVQRDWYVLPDSLQLEYAVHRAGRTSQARVYEVPVYLANIRAVARFDVAARVAAMTAAQTGVTLHLERARLMIPVSTTRAACVTRARCTALTADGFEPGLRLRIAAIAGAAGRMRTCRAGQPRSTCRSTLPARRRCDSCRSRVPPA